MGKLCSKEEDDYIDTIVIAVCVVAAVIFISTLISLFVCSCREHTMQQKLWDEEELILTTNVKNWKAVRSADYFKNGYP